MVFPMMGAVIWMLFVLSALAGTSAVLTLLSAMLVAGSGAWVWGRWGGIGRPRGTRIAAAVLAFVLALGGPAFAIASFSAARATGTEAASAAPRTGAGVDSLWQAWSPDAVEQFRGQGRPVFIDFTARWCLSCQVNERFALDNPKVRGRFRELGVVALRADWTDKNQEIAKAIAGYGRAGVPVYVVYGRGALEPVLLPELLTPSIVLEALDKAAMKP
jgi:thiol:disulfide interchange protein